VASTPRARASRTSRSERGLEHLRHRELLDEGRPALRVRPARGAACGLQARLQRLEARRVLAVEAVAQAGGGHRAHDVDEQHLVGAGQAEELIETCRRRRLQEGLEGHCPGLGLARDLTEVLVTGAAVEGVVDARLRLHQRRASRQVQAGIGRQFGDRHLEQRRDAAGRRRGGTGVEVLARVDAGVARVHVRVDDARQHVQAAPVDRLRGDGPRLRIEEVDDTAVGDGDRRVGEAGTGDQGGVRDDQVVHAGDCSGAERSCDTRRCRLQPCLAFRKAQVRRAAADA
jgi:hypothetical protein